MPAVLRMLREHWKIVQERRLIICEQLTEQLNLCVYCTEDRCVQGPSKKWLLCICYQWYRTDAIYIWRTMECGKANIWTACHIFWESEATMNDKADRDVMCTIVVSLANNPALKMLANSSKCPWITFWKNSHIPYSIWEFQIIKVQGYRMKMLLKQFKKEWVLVCEPSGMEGKEKMNHRNLQWRKRKAIPHNDTKVTSISSFSEQ